MSQSTVTYTGPA